jgi:hypothetical protein
MITMLCRNSARQSEPSSPSYRIPNGPFKKDLDIQEYTDPEHNPMIPHTLVPSTLEVCSLPASLSALLLPMTPRAKFRPTGITEPDVQLRCLPITTAL